jgi:hypothetical protein
MAEAKNHFIGGKMNRDIEDRLLKNSEYRDALNITVNQSSENNVGSVENIKSNVLAYTTSLGYSNAQPIGYVVDERDNSIYWFVTTFYFNPGVKEYPTVDDYCAILKFNQTNSSFSTVLERRFLRFCHKHLITGVNIIDNYLFWTDNFNQPRRIDLTLNESFYNYDEQLSIPRCAPYSVATVLIKNDAGNIVNSMEEDVLIESNFLKERFVRFSYRFKFVDNSYSTMAPFTQTLFIPKKFFETQDLISTYKTTENVCMVNIVTKLICKIELPSHNMYKDYFVKGIDILLKESDSTIIRSIEYIDIQNYNDNTSTRYDDSGVIESDPGNGNIFYYNYKSNVPSKTLPESQYLRVWDRVPRLAKAQEVTGSRIVYGNYLENYKLPELDYFVNFVHKDDHDFWLEYPHHSVKQNRSYQVGIVLTDIVGRSSSVIITKDSPDSHVFVPYINTAQPNTDDEPWHGLALQMNFRSPIPNPYSIRTQLFTNENNKFIAETYNPSNKLYEYSFDSDVSSELSVGDWLLGLDGNHVRIFAVDSGLVSTEGRINALYGLNWWTTDPPGKVYKYEINKNGWHSYRIVVKQKQQDYYNVYTPAVVNYKDRSWITLHSDNINKVPRDLTMTGREDGTYASSTILHAKVIKNRFPDVPPFTGSEHNQKGSIQFTNVAFPISVISIGTASDQKIQVGGTNAPWLYEKDKDHLLAEIEDNADLNGICSYGLYVDYIPALTPSIPPTVRGALKEYNDKNDGTTQYDINEAEVHLNVFETRPIESLLDIFWETSSIGLVEDLNFDINNFVVEEEDPNTPGQILPENILDNDDNIVDKFYESYVAGTIICTFNAEENGSTIANYQLNRVYHNLISGTIDESPTDKFQLINVPGTPNKAQIKITYPSYHENNGATPSTLGAYYNKFYFEIKVTTISGASALRTFVMYLKNSNPYTYDFRTAGTYSGDSNMFNPRWGKFLTIENNVDYLNLPTNWNQQLVTNTIARAQPINTIHRFDSCNGTADLSRIYEDIVYKIESCTLYDYQGNVLNITKPFKIYEGNGNTLFQKINQPYKPESISGVAPVMSDCPPQYGGYTAQTDDWVSNNDWINDTLKGKIDPRIKITHLIISSRDCNGNTGWLSNGTGPANLAPTNMYELWVNHMFKNYSQTPSLLSSMHFQKYELTHPTIVNTLDNSLFNVLSLACSNSSQPNHILTKRLILIGRTYEFIDNKWWRVAWYYFKSNSNSGASTPSNKGYSMNGYFYKQKVQEVSATEASTTPSTREGNTILSYTYGKNNSLLIGSPNQTLNTAAGKQLRSVLITSNNETGIANSWGCYLYHFPGNSNFASPLEYQLIVEWDNATDSISKLYLLKTTN